MGNSLKEGLVAISSSGFQAQPQESPASTKWLEIIQKTLCEGKEVQQEILVQLRKTNVVHEKLLDFLNAKLQ